jgi:hydroxymethylglutaryl-CoA lyase
MRVEIIEVGPRDGLQNESAELSLEQREWLITALARAGLKRIEMGAFVSPKWVPQMAGSGELHERLNGAAAKGASVFKGVRFSALVPNLQGMQDALSAGVREVAIFGACSETFSHKNINCSIDESFDRFKEVMTLARAQKVPVRGYLSAAFGCPYEGKVDRGRVVALVKRMLKLGVYEVSVGDTIGVATPKPVRLMLKTLLKTVPAKRLAMHFHDTRGTALANVLASLDMGIRKFDSSVGGLGGCPYAKGASGNLATEDLVYMCEGMGFKTGADLGALLALREPLERMIGRALPGRMMKAGLPS